MANAHVYMAVIRDVILYFLKLIIGTFIWGIGLTICLLILFIVVTIILGYLELAWDWLAAVFHTHP